MPKKFTYNEVKEIVERDGTILLSRRYEGSHEYLDLKCPKNHEYRAQFYNFKNGHRCPHCAIKYKADKHRIPYESVKAYFEERGYTLLSKEYKTNMDYLDIVCPRGHKLKKKFAHFKMGDGCSQCYGNVKHNKDYIRDYLKRDGYDYTGEYKNAGSDISMICPKGHSFKMRFNTFQQGHRCPVCSAGQTSSKGEKEIYEYVKSIYGGRVLENDRKTIQNPLTGRFLELDIYLPELNFAIEFNGSYWHSKEKAIKKDEAKLNECKQKGILLYIITDSEWQLDKEKISSKIKKIITSLST